MVIYAYAGNRTSGPLAFQRFSLTTSGLFSSFYYSEYNYINIMSLRR